MKLIATSFPYPLMNHMEIWYGTKVLVFFVLKKHCWFNCNPQFWSLLSGYQWWLRSKLPTEYHQWWKNDEAKYPIDTAKQSPNDAVQIETALFLSIAEVPIVTTKYQFFQVLKYLLVYDQFL